MRRWGIRKDNQERGILGVKSLSRDGARGKRRGGSVGGLTKTKAMWKTHIGTNCFVS